MIWNADSVVALVSWFVFVFWDPLQVSMDEYDMYDMSKKARLPSMLRFNRMVFPIVWFILQLLLVVFMFLFTQFTIDPHHYTFIVVTVLMLFNELVRKTWSAVFFQQKNFVAAFVICLVLLASAVPVCVFTVIGNNIGEDGATPDNLRWMLFAFYTMYTVWLLVATILTAAWTWGRDETTPKSDVERPPPLFTYGRKKLR